MSASSPSPTSHDTSAGTAGNELLELLFSVGIDMILSRHDPLAAD
jgi:hypothetical protein